MNTTMPRRRPLPPIPIHSWDDIREDREGEPSTPLSGWRFSNLVHRRGIVPFSTNVARSTCHFAVGRTDNEIAEAGVCHDGQLVHPGCVCGLHFVRTVEQLVEYRAHYLEEGPEGSGAGDRGLARIRRVYGHNYLGHVLLRVRTTPISNVLGPAEPRATWAVKDPAGTARTNALELTDIYFPAHLPTYATSPVIRKYPDVRAWQLPGDFDSATDCGLDDLDADEASA